MSARTPKRHDLRLPISTDSESPVSAFLTTFGISIDSTFSSCRNIDLATNQNVWRSVALSVGGPDQCRQLVPTGVFHYYVQRFGMVRFRTHIYRLYSYCGVGQ